MDSQSENQPQSVTLLLRQLKRDDPDAADQIWQRYFERLLPLARKRLANLPRTVADEEDVLVSVFDRFFKAAKEGRFAKLNDRDDLWKILLMLTDRRVTDQYRHTLAKSRGGGRVTPMSNLGDDDRGVDPASDEPDVEFLAAFGEQVSLALAALDNESTRDVALLRLEGYTNREVAEKLEISLSSVERKLRVIRDAWARAFNAE